VCCSFGAPLGFLTLSLARPEAVILGTPLLTTILEHPFEKEVIKGDYDIPLS